MTTNALLIDSCDDVATVLQTVPAGGPVRWASGGPIPAREEIPIGHKMAIRTLAAGALIRKYGFPIGTAGAPIFAGDHVHTHNLAALEQ